MSLNFSSTELTIKCVICWINYYVQNVYMYNNCFDEQNENVKIKTVSFQNHPFEKIYAFKKTRKTKNDGI